MSNATKLLIGAFVVMISALGIGIMMSLLMYAVRERDWPLLFLFFVMAVGALALLSIGLDAL